ncbi:hypothetical protein [Roseofilum sp. Belize BBD 4]|nr:hypothetical protein [Roseofilum sp. Belize BBD 4]
MQVQVQQSFHFPNFAVGQVIREYLERSKIEGRNRAMKEFRD